MLISLGQNVQKFCARSCGIQNFCHCGPSLVDLQNCKTTIGLVKITSIWDLYGATARDRERLAACCTGRAVLGAKAKLSFLHSPFFQPSIPFLLKQIRFFPLQCRSSPSNVERAGPMHTCPKSGCISIRSVM